MSLSNFVICLSRRNTPIDTKIPDRLYSSIEIEVRAHQPEVLKSYSWFINKAAADLEVRVGESWNEPEPHMLRKTLLKSKHVHSKHRVQYEFRTYFWYIKVERLTGSTADTFLEYVQRFLPEGVSMKVTKHQLTDFPDNVRKSVDLQIQQLIQRE